MRSVRTAVDIDAPRAVVWTHLRDLSTYPRWNPHITAARGELRTGSDLDITVSRAGADDRELTVRVTEVVPQRRIEWVGTLVHPWLFRAHHTFRLEALGERRTRLHNEEDVSGLFAPLALTREPERDYEAMNRTLKERVERAVGVAAE